uniref:Uncharacterized protein n=1 Tax=Anguilla anguilla TaxID=7936 RepID=A0A0E9TI42_ANGAN
MRLLWLTLDTRPTVAMQVSNTWTCCFGRQLHDGGSVHLPQQHSTGSCSTDVLGTFPRVQLQVVDQRAHR